MRIEGQWVRSTFGTRPERLATGGGSVLGEVEQQLLNRVIVLLFKLMSSPFNAVLKVLRFLRDQEIAQSFQGLFFITGLFKGGTKPLWLRQVQVDCLRRLREVDVEKILRPSNGVLYAIWKAAKRTHRERLLRRILRTRV